MGRVKPGRYPLGVQNASFENTIYSRRRIGKGLSPRGLRIDENGKVNKVENSSKPPNSPKPPLQHLTNAE